MDARALAKKILPDLENFGAIMPPFRHFLCSINTRIQHACNFSASVCFSISALCSNIISTYEEKLLPKKVLKKSSHGGFLALVLLCYNKSGI